MAGFGEFEFIAELLSPLSADGALGLTDDAAFLPDLPVGENWTVTKDAMVEGVHFLPGDPPDRIARKLLRVNLSDLAAMGARPVAYLLALSLDSGRDRDWLASFARGLAEDQATFGIGLFGGDTTSTPGLLTLSLTALGTVQRDRALRRNSAQAGDAIWVTGTLGDAALGLRVLQDGDDLAIDTHRFLADRYQLPQPRVSFGQALRGKATACLDVSDGLLADLGHMARQSSVGIDINREAIPLSAAARAVMAGRPDLEHLPVIGGDDYELVFALPEGAEPPVHDGLRCTCIGQITNGGGVRLLEGGEPVSNDRTGWRHF